MSNQNWRRVRRAAFPLLLSFVMACAGVPDGLAAGASAGRGQGAKKQEPERGRIRVEVNLVNVLVSVLDKNNRPAADLPKEAFELYEEGVEQKIEVFEPETQQPLDLALMIDSSLSTQLEMAFEKEAAAHFIRQVLRRGDRLSVYEVSETVTQLTVFSDDVPLLQGAVRRIGEGAGTSLYDAVYQGARALGRRDDTRRKVIVLVTDAGETTSRLDFESARKEALRVGVLLYTIVIRPVKTESGRNTAGEHALQTITESTGGGMFFPDEAQELDAMFERIDRELRTQYRLGYYPNPRGAQGSFRRIQVKVRGEYQVRHRAGYFTAGEGPEK